MNSRRFARRLPAVFGAGAIVAMGALTRGLRWWRQPAAALYNNHDHDHYDHYDHADSHSAAGVADRTDHQSDRR